MKTVSIFGAGIAGLTIAHELANRGFQVDVYEQSDSIGGMAKSKRIDISQIPTEHSWRGYLPFYQNLFDIMRQISIPSNLEHFSNTISHYTMEEVSKHNKPDDLWTVYKGNVYNLSSFVSDHPGGYVILKAGGKNVEEVWNEHNVYWHTENTFVEDTLSKYKIGTLQESFSLFKSSVYNNLSPILVNVELLKSSESVLNREISISPQDYPYLAYLYLSVVLSDRRNQSRFEQP